MVSYLIKAKCCAPFYSIFEKFTFKLLEYPELGIPNLDPLSPPGEWVLRSSGHSEKYHFSINTTNVRIFGLDKLFVKDFRFVQT